MLGFIFLVCSFVFVFVFLPTSWEWLIPSSGVICSLVGRRVNQGADKPSGKLVSTLRGMMVDGDPK